MHPPIFTEISLVIVLAAAVALIMRLVRQPLIIGHILTGVLLGPGVLHLVRSPQTIDTFSNIGITLLLFIIGLGLNPRVIKEVGRAALVVGSLQVLATAAFAWAAGILLGLSRTEATFLGMGLAFSSTIIVLKLLSDKKEQSRLYGKIVIGLLLVQDVLAMAAMLFITSRSGGNFSPTQLVSLAVRGAVIAVPLLIIGNLVLPRLHRLVAGSQEFLFLFALGWGFGSAALFERTGFSLEIGALIAGVSLASLPYTQEISARLRPLRDFFIVVFFISLGTRLNLGSLGAAWGLIIAGSLVAVVLKPLVILVIMGLMGYTKRTSFKTAISLAQISEFSLVLAVLGSRQGLVGERLVSVFTMVALISIAASTYLVIYADRLFILFERHLSLFERRKTHFEQESRATYELILFGYQKGGHEFVKVFRALKKRFVVIDYDPEVIDSLEHHKIDYLYGDAADIELLEEAGLDRAKLVVSTMSDFEVNLFLMKLINQHNRRAVVIMHADSADQARQLYDHGASYVVIPHYIGTEKISSFIRQSHLKKSEFKKYRQKHLAYLEAHYDLAI